MPLRYYEKNRIAYYGCVLINKVIKLTSGFGFNITTKNPKHELPSISFLIKYLGAKRYINKNLTKISQSEKNR